jgi:hypothetical protein
MSAEEYHHTGASNTFEGIGTRYLDSRLSLIKFSGYRRMLLSIGLTDQPY